MAEKNISKKIEPSSKKSELPKKTAPKSEVNKSETSKPEASKAETSPAESTKIDKAETTVDASPKSTSQASISHFSSVSTPEYRSGWNKIFNDGLDTEKVNNTENILPNRIEISDEDIDINLRQILNQQIENLLKEQGYELSEAKNSVFFEYDIGCTINYK